MESKTALVTGASRGIGAAIAAELAGQGFFVYGTATSESGAATISEQLQGQGHGLVLQVQDQESVDRGFTEILERGPAPLVVVNNAGFHRGGKISRLEQKDWEDVLDTNLTGAMNVIKHSSAYLDRGSAIVNVGAVVGFRGFPGDSAYAASKAGLGGLTRALAVELAVKGVTVNMVIPGLVLTDMTRNLSEKALESMRNTIPLKRYGQAQEVAEVVCWVASSTYMTGAFVPVDGGLMSSFGVPG